MLKKLQGWSIFKKLMKTAWYSRVRAHFPNEETAYYEDDLERLESAEKVLIDWPEGQPRPVCGVIKDFDPYPRWTKVVRFLENNHIPYELFDIHAHDWIEQARKFDIIIGIASNTPFHLEELRRKFFLLETYMGKTCFPSTKHIMLYEDKTLEAFISQAMGLPYAPTHISNDKEDALRLIARLHYPVIHKLDPCSGSVGVELVRDEAHARKIVNQAFSPAGRPTHVLYRNQKNSVYFQEFVPNDGYDVRVMITGNLAFGLYRKVPVGDFRASGMKMIEMRALPEEAVRIAWKANQLIQSPLLVVDMVRGLDGQYTIVEFSPISQMEKPERLVVDGVPGVYHIDEDGHLHFEPMRVWVYELALREFLLHDYLPTVLPEAEVAFAR